MLQKPSIQNKTIGVIGYGNFGKVVCNSLFPKNKILLYSKHANESELPKHIILEQDLKSFVENSDILIPAIPIRKFENVIKQIAQFLKTDQIVMDICSVMEYPVEVMKRNLPSFVQIIATHPMFGPNSLKKRQNNMRDLLIVLSNVKSDPQLYIDLKKYFQSLSLKIIEITPKEHDKLSAHSHFFASLVGEFGKQLQLKHTMIDTPGAAAIIDALQHMGADRIIIEDMITYNPYCKDILDSMIQTLHNLNNK